MIPLANWLESHGAPAAPFSPSFDSLFESGASQQPNSSEPESFAEREHLSNRVKELEVMLQATEEQSQEERIRQAAREQALERNLSEEVAAQINGSVKATFCNLQEAVESALVEVLLPFLRRTAAQRAAGDLIGLLREMLASTAEPLIELKAPARLHETLNSALERAGIAVLLREGEAVELVFSSQTARLQELGANWVQLLEGHNL